MGSFRLLGKEHWLWVMSSCERVLVTVRGGDRIEKARCNERTGNLMTLLSQKLWRVAIVALAEEFALPFECGHRKALCGTFMMAKRPVVVERMKFSVAETHWETLWPVLVATMGLTKLTMQPHLVMSRAESHVGIYFLSMHLSLEAMRIFMR